MGGSADNDSVNMRSGSYLRVDWQVNRLWKGSISRINCSLGWGGVRLEEAGEFVV